MLSRRIASRLRDMETPFYLYDTELLRQTLESVVNESKRYNYKVHYAIKANYDDRLLAIIREYGLGVDCASGNEVQKAIEAGFDPKSIVYAGVGKRDKELRYAIEQEIMAINCESIEELLVLDAMAAEAGRTVEVALRVNPDIDPKTNHCIDTGQADSKFGISYEEILDNAERIRSLKHLRIVGVHLHIGSQIRELHVFENMCQKVNVIVENLERLGFSFRFVDVGGGLGINYDMPENEPIPNFASLFAIVHNHLRVGELNVDGSRQRIHAIELVNDFAGAHGIAEVLQGFVFRGEADALHAVHLLDGLHDRIDVGLFGIVRHIRRDGNLVFHRLHRVVDNKAANKENADDKQG